MRRNADYGVRRRVQRQNLPHHIGIRSEFIGPQAEAYYRHIIAARLGVLVRQKETSRNRAQSEDFKIVCTDHLTENLRRLRTTAPRQWKWAYKASEPGENLVLSRIVLEIRVRHSQFRRICRGDQSLAVNRIHFDETRNVLDGQRIQENSVHNGEDSGVSANSEGQR